MPHVRCLDRGLCATVGVIASALALVGCGSSGSSSPTAASAVTVQASVSDCGKGWTGGRAGLVNFVVDDTDSRAGEVDLVDRATGRDYLEIEPLGPGTSDRVHVELAAGRYAFRCSMEDEPSVYGPTVQVSGTVKNATPGVVPVAQADLLPAIAAYKAYVTKQLPGLLADVRTMDGDITAGHLTAARSDWLPAHLAYIRLGGAYGAFGDIDGDINGLAEGLPRGVHDPSWQGFHRIEYGLWHGQSTAQLTGPAATLVANVQKLITQFPDVQVDPLDIGIRAHEITEDAVRFALTQRDDYGSNSDLATVRADVDATRAVLDVVRPLLTSRYPQLARADAQLDLTAKDLDALQRPDGSWPALGSLTREQRERIDSDLGEQAELLAPVAMILEPRRTS